MAAESEIRPETFQCAECGVCCSTQKVVLLTIADIFRIAEKRGMRPGAFYRRYCMKSQRYSEEGLLRIYLKTDGGCPFVKDRHCSVHDFKPLVCARSPFYYVESSLAVLKVLGVIVPGCSIDRLPYATVARGDRERLIDMEIEVSITDDYMHESGKFDEKTARDCNDRIREALADGGCRTMAYQKLLDESMRREGHYRNDPYYRGATWMYLSGFYHEFRKEAERLAGIHDNLLTFEPAAVGTAGGEMLAALLDEDFKEARRRLEGKEGEVIVSSSVSSGFEYSTVTIATGERPTTFFYYYIDVARKPAIKRLPGKVSITFTNNKKETFTFSGDDRSGWLQ